MGGGGGKSAKLESKSAQQDETQVVLNLYDLTPLNHYTYWFGFGIFHSGIEVHGMEYGFGAHDFPVSGVFEVEPKTCPGFVYRNSIPLGSIKLPPSEFRQLIENIVSNYQGDAYHLITKNCNHFTEDVASRLTGKSIPRWVNRLSSAEEDTGHHSARNRLEYAEADEEKLLPVSPSNVENINSYI